MKIQNISIAAFLASLFLAGCSADGTPDTDAFPPVEATVPLTIESASLSAEVSTRAVGRASTLTTGSIGVYRKAGNGYTRVLTEYKYENSNWVSTSPIYLGGTATNVSAYHPWGTVTPDINGQITLTSQVYADDKDLSFATDREVNGSTSGKNVTFDMERAYAKFKLKLKKDANYPYSCKVTEVKLSNLAKTGTLSLHDGYPASVTGVLGETISTTANDFVVDTEKDWGSDFLFVPCTPAGSGMTIEITVDGKPMTITLTTTQYTPERGKYNSIILLIKASELGITQVTKEDWDNIDDPTNYIPTIKP